ncbi:MAG TPA: CocE/NonD family hydrolase, partial [Mycobacteriales bacterium]|nr:CocE/NonD family hydrolase [Mycobacteriales bacterium]
MRRLTALAATSAMLAAVSPAVGSVPGAAAATGSDTRAGAATLTVGAAPSGWQPRAATYGVHVTEDVPVTMSDGTVLRVNVYRPARDDGSPAPGRFPVILTQTPYNKSAPQLGFRNDFLVEHGYVQVVADVRGTGSSEGSWDSFGAREQKDGAELVRWAHSRERGWSNGRVGL